MREAEPDVYMDQDEDEEEDTQHSITTFESVVRMNILHMP